MNIKICQLFIKIILKYCFKSWDAANLAHGIPDKVIFYTGSRLKHVAVEGLFSLLSLKSRALKKFGSLQNLRKQVQLY